MPAAVIITTAFQTLAEHERATKGVPGLPLLVVDHPLGGVLPDEVARRAAQAGQALGAAATAPSPEPVQLASRGPARAPRR